MEKFIQACFNHSRTVIFLLVLLTLMGLSTYMTIPKESAPDVKIPIIFVQMRLEGISPADAERLLVRPIEVKVRSIEGLKEMRATAYQGGANVTLEFQAGFDSDKARIDVRDKVDDARADLPADADDPIVKEVNFSLFPVLAVHLYGDVPKRTLYQLAEDVQDAVEGRVASVLEAKIVGDQEEAVEIVVDPRKLNEYSLSITETLDIVRRNNVLVSAGAIDTGRGKFAVKVPGLIETVADLMEIPLIVSDDAVVKVSDIAEIHRTYKDTTGYARFNGDQAITIEVSKRTGENILETVGAVRAIVNQLNENWPSSVQVAFTQDESNKIKDMLTDLQNNLIAAVILVMAVMILAMGWRSAALVGIAVPGAFLIGVLVIGLFGFTLNIVVLFSLILSVGMLVDGAIIVAEFADRQMVAGKSRFEAFLVASQRMAWPVFSSIVTTLVVFFPLLFWPGVVGQFMKFMPITLLATLTASMFMALVFVPTIGSLIGQVSKSTSAEMVKNIQLTETGSLKKLTGLTRTYVVALEKALAHPGKVILASLALVVFVQQLYSHFGKGVEFFPNIEPDTALIKVRARGNMSVNEKDAIVRQVEEVVFGIEGIKTFYTNTDIAPGRGGGKGGNLQEDVIGTITMEFTNWETRDTVDEILEVVMEKTAPIPGILIETFKNKPGPPTDKPIEIQISSDFPELLDEARLTLIQYLETLEDVIKIEDDKPIPGIEWVYRVDRAQALKFGADVSLIGGYIRMATNGIPIDTYRPNDARDEVDILVRFPQEYRTLDQLKQIRVRTQNGVVPLSTFVTEVIEPKFATLKRSDAKRAYVIKADVPPGVLADDKIQIVNKWLETRPFHPRVLALFKGEEEDKKETSAFLGKAFAIAICAIAIILVTQFNSFFSMFLVLSSILFSTVGMFLGLLITNQAFSIVMCGIGIIALSGIIVSNNILIIDTFDLLKKTSKDMKQVILRTGAQRLRPVILTQLTTSLGLLPIMLGLDINFFDGYITQGGPSTQWWIQLSTSLVFGIVFASPLTLFVTPCALMLKENLAKKSKT